jgi:hypothetical protein
MGSMLPHGYGRPLSAEAREAHVDTTVGGSGDLVTRRGAMAGFDRICGLLFGV